MYAHIFGTKEKGFELHVTTDSSLNSAIKVEWHATKASAKKSAKEQGLKPWNY